MEVHYVITDWQNWFEARDLGRVGLERWVFMLTWSWPMLQGCSPQSTHTVPSHDQLTPPSSSALLSNLWFIHPPPPWPLRGLFLQPSPPLALPCGGDGDLSVHQERQEDYQRTAGGKESQGSCQGNAANSTHQWWTSEVEEEGKKRGGGRWKRRGEGGGGERWRRRAKKEGRRRYTQCNYNAEW